jgi:hypothetical protein
MDVLAKLRTKTGTYQVRSLNVPMCGCGKMTASWEVLQDSNRSEFPSGKAFLCNACYMRLVKNSKVETLCSATNDPLPSPMGTLDKYGKRDLPPELTPEKRKEVDSFMQGL